MLILSIKQAKEIIELGTDHKVCPYELAMILSKTSDVIVTDYYYMFHPSIRENFLKKNNLELKDCIIIVDEAHNLPERIKDLASHTLSTTMIKRAISEAKKYNFSSLATVLERLKSTIFSYKPVKDEDEIQKDKLTTSIGEFVDYVELVKELYDAGEKVTNDQKISSMNGIAACLEAWLGSDVGFVRVVSKKRGLNEDNVMVSYRCLDPSIISKDIFKECYSSIVMSGTLTPPEMYKELLGISSNTIKEFPSPFPRENRLNIIVDKTSTKFTSRSVSQYQEMAKIITDIINETPGNSAIFFPSYYIKEQVEQYLTKVEKTVFQEMAGMSKAEKEGMIERFKGYKKTGAALLAVVSGSFGEGIDLPGDELKTVVVIGLPLTKPSIEISALIKYYDEKFKRGWDYGYVFPAFNKIIQNAGRCIRSETDRGVIVFIDERFAWPRYRRCFPSNWDIKVDSVTYKDKIRDFFKKE